MIEREPETQGYFVMLKPMAVAGTKTIDGRDESSRFYIDPSEYPELVRDLDEWLERFEQTTKNDN